ncbi:S-glutathionyl-(chloro)hydroquinone reductase [Dissophora globulifera]|uniref:S-glutathionyl-(Chloro)hydroquinone reductase n=1 Tax=Dissophora globulifera TaxID=979702 RepID=A0A9P6R3M7_9FUNG|nr:S-glutathionyl-(chloro)hydroquinone reductase [Dissophora globulifera]
MFLNQAHRALIVLALKGLEDFISVDNVHWHMVEKGWPFKDGYRDPLYGSVCDRDLYYKAEPEYSARFTVPILWDKETEAIVNNESSDIIRILSTSFNKLAPEKAEINYHPDDLKEEIDSVNEWVYNTINNGVYQTGLAETQDAYEKATYQLFESLDREEGILSKSDYLVGNTLTEADLSLWPTIVRFDPFYHGIFKCSLKSIEKDYPNILKWARRIYKMPGVANTVKMEHIKGHYWHTLVQINPKGIIPVGNGPNFAEPKIV